MRLPVRLGRAGEHSAGRPRQIGLPLPRRRGVVGALLALRARGVLLRLGQLRPGAATRSSVSTPRRVSARAASPAARWAAAEASPSACRRPASALAIRRSSASASVFCAARAAARRGVSASSAWVAAASCRLVALQRHRLLAKLSRQAAQHEHAAQRVLGACRHGQQGLGRKQRQPLDQRQQRLHRLAPRRQRRLRLSLLCRQRIDPSGHAGGLVLCLAQPRRRRDPFGRQALVSAAAAAAREAAFCCAAFSDARARSACSISWRAASSLLGRAG